MLSTRMMVVLVYIGVFSSGFSYAESNKKTKQEDLLSTIDLQIESKIQKPTKFYCKTDSSPSPKVSFKNWGIYNNECNSHIQINQAWDIHKVKNPVVVAVIDTGVDFNHPDLRNKNWNSLKNKNEIGWNFVSNNSEISDDHGHGTHISGIITANLNKKMGISGIAPEVKIMGLKFYSSKLSGEKNVKNTVDSINYAINNGAKIINYSGGGPEFNEDEYLALKKAEHFGVLVVAAAGNENQNTDIPENRYYPAAYRLSNIISVGAIDINNRLIASSNWGKKTVDVVAPGENIYSTLPGGNYGYMTGTSQATAFVTGLAAILLSENPNLTPQAIKKIIEQSVDTVPPLLGKIKTGGKINAFKALKLLQEKRIVKNNL